LKPPEGVGLFFKRYAILRANAAILMQISGKTSSARVYGRRCETKGIGQGLGRRWQRRGPWPSRADGNCTSPADATARRADRLRLRDAPRGARPFCRVSEGQTARRSENHHVSKLLDETLMAVLAMPTEHAEYRGLEKSSIMHAAQDQVLLVSPQSGDERLAGIGINISGSGPLAERTEPSPKIWV